MKITAIITAGGTGSRFSKSGKPKQYLNLNGHPVILYSLISFQKCKAVDEIIVSASKEYFEFIHSLSLNNKITKLTKLVEGGRTRFESVRNAFMQIDSADIAVIHDAARPNIDVYFIERLIIELQNSAGVVPGIKISETIKRVKGGIVTETIDREDLYSVQTPQVFNFRKLKLAYEKCGDEADFTDEASLVESAGYKVRLTEGKKDNIKITKPDDISITKTYLSKPLQGYIKRK